MREFSDEQREHIRQELLRLGREHFARYTLKKMTIVDLTCPVDSTPSTFYRFFESKEELYLEVLEREGERFYERAITPLEEATDPAKAIEEHLYFVFEELETNPLIERLLADDELEQLSRLSSEDEFIEQQRRELCYIIPYSREWQEVGAIREGDLETIAATIDSTAVLAFHKEEIGEDLYPTIRDMMIETVVTGLTTTAARNEIQPQEQSPKNEEE